MKRSDFFRGMWLSPLALAGDRTTLPNPFRTIDTPTIAAPDQVPPASGETLNVKSLGAVGDGSKDDTEAIQAVFDAAPDGSVVFFDQGSYKTSSQLTVSNSITIQGSGQYTCEILAVGTSGLKVNKKSNFHMFDIDIAASSRHTVDANTFIGIEVDGDDTLRPFNHIYRNVYVDGFRTAFRSDYLWASVFDNFRSGFGAIGIHARQLSANNVVANCSLNGGHSEGDRGIWLEGVPVASEGWLIHDSVTYNYEIGILGQGVTHVQVSNNIIDHNLVSGVVINSNGANDFGGNWTVCGNYIAMDGSAGNAAIKCGNAISNGTNRGNQIYGNHVLVYETGVCGHGIWMQGAQAKNNAIIGNTLQGFTSNDIRCVSGNGNVVVGNTCLSVIPTNIRDADVSIANVGTASGFPVLTFGASDTAPGIRSNGVLARLCKSGSATKITNFDDGQVGDVFSLLAAHDVTIIDGENIHLRRSRNFEMKAGDVVEFAMFDDQIWEEISRKVS